MSEAEQNALFAVEEFDSWKDEWRGMPEYVHQKLQPWKSVVVHFKTRTDMAIFSDLVGERLTIETQSIWYPKAEINRLFDKRYVDVSTEIDDVAWTASEPMSLSDEENDDGA